MMNGADFFQSVQNLAAVDSQVNACAERHAQHESSVKQRLKWAAGANPSLSNTLKDFEESCHKRDHLVQVCVEIASDSEVISG